MCEFPFCLCPWIDLLYNCRLSAHYLIDVLRLRAGLPTKQHKTCEIQLGSLDFRCLVVSDHATAQFQVFVLHDLRRIGNITGDGCVAGCGS